jgi:uncharacterized membrane protein
MSILPENSLGFISVEEAVGDKASEYLGKAFENVYKFHEIDKELAQGRTNFQLEKFALLETYTLESAYESVLKSRRQMAEGLMSKLLEMQEKVREFEYKWNDEDKTKPIKWECTGGGPGGGGTKLCWFDLDQMQLEHFLRSSELEVRDRLYQMEHLDKMLAELTERNGGKPVTKEQFASQENLYWERRFAEQSLDSALQNMTGLNLGDIHSMRRASAPSLVDPRNQLENSYLPTDMMMGPMEDRVKFLQDLQNKVMQGYEDVMGLDLGAGNYLPPDERKKMVEAKIEKHRQELALMEAQKQERLKAQEQQQIMGSPENVEIIEE